MYINDYSNVMFWLSRTYVQECITCFFSLIDWLQNTAEILKSINNKYCTTNTKFFSEHKRNNISCYFKVANYIQLFVMVIVILRIIKIVFMIFIIIVQIIYSQLIVVGNKTVLHYEISIDRFLWRYEWVEEWVAGLTALQGDIVLTYSG